MRRILIAAGLVALIAMPGCGVILGYGGYQPIDVLTNEAGQGALIYVDGIPTKPEVTAPGQVMVHIKGPHRIELKKEGYMTGAAGLKKDIRIDIVLLDILTLGIGHLVDYLTGAMYRYDTPVPINLGKAPEPTPQPTPTITTQPDGTQPVLEPEEKAPCPICGEPRGDETPCPHCGMD